MLPGQDPCCPYPYHVQLASLLDTLLEVVIEIWALSQAPGHQDKCGRAGHRGLSLVDRAPGRMGYDGGNGSGQSHGGLVRYPWVPGSACCLRDLQSAQPALD